MLLRDSERVPLEPKVFETLLVLIRHPGRLVPKEELMQAVWPDSFVEESNLTRNISILRKALSRNDRGLQYIETVPKRGYRFVGEVQVLSGERRESIVPPASARAPVEPEENDDAPDEPRTPSDSQMVAALVGRHRGEAIGAIAVFCLTLVGVWYFFAQTRQPAPIQTSTPVSPGPRLQDLRITQLTATGNADRPAISPDGKYVAYIQTDGNDDSVWIRQTATNSNVQVVRPTASERLIGVTVPPDGNFIDFVRGRDRQFALWRIPFLGGTPRKLLDDVHTPVGWSPDGALAAFIRRDQAAGSSSLMIVDADGSHERTLSVRRDPANFSSVLGAGFPGPRPAWSPDGRVIAMPGGDWTGAAHVQRVVFVDVRTGSGRTVPLPEGGDGAGLGVAWLNGGSLLLTRASATGLPSQLWWLSHPNGGLTRVTNDLSSYLRVSLTADRDSLVTVRSEVHGGVWIADGTAAHGADAVPMGPGTMGSGGIAWRAHHLLYVTKMNGPAPIVRLVPGGAPEEVMSSALAPIVTPDDRTLVFASAAVGVPGLL